VKTVVFAEEYRSPDGARDRFWTVYYTESDTPDVIKSFSVCIHVYNYGLDNEEAYFKGSKPMLLRQTTAPPTFRDELTEKLEELVSQIPNLIDVVIESVMEERIAYLRAFVQGDTGLREKRYVVLKSKDGRFTIYQLEKEVPKSP